MCRTWACPCSPALLSRKGRERDPHFSVLNELNWFGLARSHASALNSGVGLSSISVAIFIFQTTFKKKNLSEYSLWQQNNFITSFQNCPSPLLSSPKQKLATKLALTSPENEDSLIKRKSVTICSPLKKDMWTWLVCFQINKLKHKTKKHYYATD